MKKILIIMEHGMEVPKLNIIGQDSEVHWLYLVDDFDVYENLDRVICEQVEHKFNYVIGIGKGAIYAAHCGTPRKILINPDTTGIPQDIINEFFNEWFDGELKYTSYVIMPQGDTNDNKLFAKEYGDRVFYTDNPEGANEWLDTTIETDSKRIW